MNHTPETTQHRESPLFGFEGRYVGVSPSDESSVRYGEVEIVIDEGLVTLRVAIGLEE